MRASRWDSPDQNDSRRAVRLTPRDDQIQKRSQVKQAMRMRLNVSPVVIFEAKRLNCKSSVRQPFPLAIILLCGLAACQNQPQKQAPAVQATTGPALRAPALDPDFHRTWDDGSAEVSTYTTERLRNGSLRKGTATVVLRRATFSEDDRVAEPDDVKAAPHGDLFPVMQMVWIEHYAMGAEACDEMTTSVVALSPVEGRAAGTETKTDFSSQSWDGQLFHQLLFDATGIRSHQYTFEREGDEQITLSYPRDGVSADALWLWARGMAAPSVEVGQERIVDLLPRLRDVRERHAPLNWKKSTLVRASATQFEVHGDGGATETFQVEKSSPFRVRQWQNSEGEHVELVTTTRMKFWK